MLAPPYLCVFLFCLQEAYWRIPGSFSLQDLRKRVEVIGQALDGSYIAEDNSKYLTFIKIMSSEQQS